MFGSTRFGKALPLLLWLGLFAVVLAGCDNDSGKRVANLPPKVWLTGGPPQLDDLPRAPYNVKIFWTGADPDGVIDHFEYTIDPNKDVLNPVFSLDEIQDPERFLAEGKLDLSVRRGVQPNTDTLTYSKSVGGELVEFSYIQTADYSRSLILEASKEDSTGLEERKGQFSQNHRLYLRAMDNEELFSPVDSLDFTAFTVTPSAHIKFPSIENVSDAGLTVGSEIRFTWDGVDIDQEAAEKKPVGYLYKLVDFNALDIPNFTDVSAEFIFTKNPKVLAIPWTYQSADTLTATAILSPGHSYMFAVRAIDEAGAVQTIYSTQPYAQQTSGNVAKFTASNFSGSPALTFKEPTLGERTGRGNFVEEFEVPPGTALRFFLSGDASQYGGVIDGFSYGVDIQNLELEDGPNSEWTSWSKDGSTAPIVFHEPDSEHTIHIRVRDTSGTITMATLLMYVVDFTFERELLVVDDYRDTNWPLQQDHTDWWIDQVTETGQFTEEDLKPEILLYRVWGPLDRDGSPTPPDLAHLGQYKMCIWELNQGNSGNNAMRASGPQRRHLTSYLRSGGKLWVNGRRTMLGILPGGGSPADVLDENNPFGGVGSFAYDTMHLYSQVDNANLGDRDRLVRSEPYPGKEEIWPTLTIDKFKLSRSGLKGMPYGDVIIEGLFAAIDPNWVQETRDPVDGGILVHGDRLDSLYVYRAAGVVEQGLSNNKFDLGLNAIRYTNSKPTSDKQHRTIWFGFPIYFVEDDEAQQMIRNVIDWFREEGIVESEL